MHKKGNDHTPQAKAFGDLFFLVLFNLENKRVVSECKMKGTKGDRDC